jgi:Uma2 family endonuclease
MSPATLSPHAPPMLRLSCDRYHAMIAQGLLTREDRVELIDGFLITKMSIGPAHSHVRSKLEKLLDRMFGDHAWVRGQEPITINEYSEPEPDISVVIPPGEKYAVRHPIPEEVIFAVEVADTSLKYDRETKIPLYAACGIAEAWLVDLTSRTVTVFSQPVGATYASQRTFGAADLVPVPGLDGASISVVELGL